MRFLEALNTVFQQSSAKKKRACSREIFPSENDWLHRPMKSRHLQSKLTFSLIRWGWLTMKRIEWFSCLQKTWLQQWGAMIDWSISTESWKLSLKREPTRKQNSFWKHSLLRKKGCLKVWRKNTKKHWMKLGGFFKCVGKRTLKSIDWKLTRKGVICFRRGLPLDLDSQKSP